MTKETAEEQKAREQLARELRDKTCQQFWRNAGLNQVYKDWGEYKKENDHLPLWFAVTMSNIASKHEIEAVQKAREEERERIKKEDLEKAKEFFSCMDSQDPIHNTNSWEKEKEQARLEEREKTAKEIYADLESDSDIRPLEKEDIIFYKNRFLGGEKE